MFNSVIENVWKKIRTTIEKEKLCRFLLILHIKKFRKFKVERAKIGENQNLQESQIK